MSRRNSAASTRPPRGRTKSNRGHVRERHIRDVLEPQGFCVVRAAGSLGPVDLVVMRYDIAPRLVEVKATKQGPYEHFGPDDRQELSRIARQAGVEAWLIHWPPFGELEWIAEHQWP
jgi:Holliday junction resolvase